VEIGKDGFVNGFLFWAKSPNGRIFLVEDVFIKTPTASPPKGKRASPSALTAGSPA
jgi:hypothetical protein